MLDLEGELKIVNIKANKNLIGKSLKELDLRRKYDLNILAIKRANDKLKLTVNPDYVINENDELIIVGVEENILKLM
jgi:trk system potassium uptake protein TrkA